MIAIKSGSVATVKNGTVTGKSVYGLFAANTYATLNLEDLVIANISTGTTNSYTYSAIYIYINMDPTVNVTNCTLSSVSKGNNAAVVSTSNTSSIVGTSYEVNLTGCTLTGVKYGLYASGNGKSVWNVTDCSITLSGTSSAAVALRGQSKTRSTIAYITITDTDISATSAVATSSTYINNSTTVEFTGSTTVDCTTFNSSSVLDEDNIIVSGGSYSVDISEYYVSSDSNMQYVQLASGAYVAGYATTVTYEATEGTVTGVDEVIAPDTEVTLTVTCETGYEVESVTVTGDSGDVTVTDNGDGTYTFTMPAEPVDVSVVFAKTIYSASDVETVYVENGSYTVIPTTATYEDTVTIVTNPDKHFKVSSVTVVDENGNLIAVTDNGDGTYSFEMPAGNVTISVSFYQFSAIIGRLIYVNEEYHGMFINGHLATYPHIVDDNGYCTVCKEYIGVDETEDED
ncbi:MAG: hypothetical protein LUF29_10125 [Oscillospiraceae bacterium]|nr:hypothetical protein [Oscillospiraceae bacterium]